MTSVIERCAAQSGWRVVERLGDRYRVVSDDHLPWRPVHIRYSEAFSTTCFQVWLPLRLPLDKVPGGLYPRLLMRNLRLVYAAWAMEIAGSCDACLCAVARLPRASIDPDRFGEVCRELVGEVSGFHQELREKFLIALDGAKPMAGDGSTRHLPGGGRAIRPL